MQDFLEKIEKRRTFAIISHPDAGKTTLTEKRLLMRPRVLRNKPRNYSGFAIAAICQFLPLLTN